MSDETPQTVLDRLQPISPEPAPHPGYSPTPARTKTEKQRSEKLARARYGARHPYAASNAVAREAVRDRSKLDGVSVLTTEEQLKLASDIAGTFGKLALDETKAATERKNYAVAWGVGDDHLSAHRNRPKHVDSPAELEHKREAIVRLGLKLMQIAAKSIEQSPSEMIDRNG